MARTAPGLAVVLATLLATAPAAEARAPVGKCKAKRACTAGGKPAKKRKPKNGTGWIGGTYNGGPGDPIIAPLPS